MRDDGAADTRRGARDDGAARAGAARAAPRTRRARRRAWRPTQCTATCAPRPRPRGCGRASSAGDGSSPVGVSSTMIFTPGWSRSRPRHRGAFHGRIANSRCGEGAVVHGPTYGRQCRKRRGVASATVVMPNAASFVARPREARGDLAGVERTHCRADHVLVARHEPVGVHDPRGQPRERARRQHRRVPAPMPEAHRIPRGGALELLRRRQPAEPRIVGAFRAQPHARRQRRRVRRELGQERIDVGRVRTVEVRVARGEREEMQVRIDQARQDRRAGAVDPLRPRARRARRGPPIADRDDTRADDRQRRRVRASRDAGTNARVLEEVAGQSDDGSGFASLSFISPPQHSIAPVPGLLQSTSTPH